MVGAGERIRLVRMPGEGGLVIAHFLQPGDGVFSPIAAGRAWRVAEAEVDFPPCEMEVFHDLHAGLAGPDDQCLALRNLRRAFVIDRVELLDRVGIRSAPAGTKGM